MLGAWLLRACVVLWGRVGKGRRGAGSGDGWGMVCLFVCLNLFVWGYDVGFGNGDVETRLGRNRYVGRR